MKWHGYVIQSWEKQSSSQDPDEFCFIHELQILYRKTRFKTWFFVFYGKDFEIALKKWIKRVIIEEGMKLKKVNVV